MSSTITDDDIQDFGSFTPEEYLSEYYHSVFSENDKLLRFFSRAAHAINKNATLLEYGGGPTIYQLISFAPKVKSIHFTDYIHDNLLAVQKWINKEERAHNWTPFVEVAIEYETGRKPSHETVTEREELVRSLLHDFGHVDALNPAVDTTPHKQYDMVSVNFVAESISKTEEDWQKSLDSILTYVKPGGQLCMTAIRGAEYWVSGGKQFPAFSVTAKQLEREILRRGFTLEMIEEIDAEIMDKSSAEYEGYDGMVFVLARRAAL